jgi:hypothetical protein
MSAVSELFNCLPLPDFYYIQQRHFTLEISLLPQEYLSYSAAPGMKLGNDIHMHLCLSSVSSLSFSVSFLDTKFDRICLLRETTSDISEYSS